MCPLKAVVDLSFCECSVFGSCKKKVSFRIFIFVEFVSGFACVGQYILRLQGGTSMNSFGNLIAGRRESALNSFQLSSILFRFCDFRRLFFSGLGAFGCQCNTVNKGTVWNFCTKTSLNTQRTPGVRE